MTTYDRIVNQTQENLDRATRRWTETQEQTAAFADEAAGRFRGVLPVAAEAVEANYRLVSESLKVQKDLMIRWPAPLEPAPRTPRKGTAKSTWGRSPRNYSSLPTLRPFPPPSGARKQG